MDTLLAIGKKIQSIRAKKGVTQDQLGKSVGMNAKYVSAIERGHTEGGVAFTFSTHLLLVTP
jgi:transcriptional regulator with XRE-family HTH domain